MFKRYICVTKQTLTITAMFEKIYICVTKQTLTITAMFEKIYMCNKTNFNNNLNV